MKILTFGNDRFINADYMVAWWLDGWDIYIQLQDMAVPTRIMYAIKKDAIRVMSRLNRTLVTEALDLDGCIFDLEPVDFTIIAKPVKIEN